MKRLAKLLSVWLMVGAPLSVAAEEALRVAVAANFQGTAEKLVAAFEAQTAFDAELISGSTGKLYAQISLGAPFDLFLAADRVRPARLLAEGRALEVRTYALGQLVLVARGSGVADDPAALIGGQRLAIADPGVAPYGLAATEVIRSFGLDPDALDLVYGENVAQVVGFFETGNVDLAMIAASQVADLSGQVTITETAALHEPVLQDVALLTGTAEAKSFLELLTGPIGRRIITEAGYGVVAGEAGGAAR